MEGMISVLLLNGAINRVVKKQKIRRLKINEKKNQQS